MVGIVSIGPPQELHIKRVTGIGATTATPGMGNAFSCPWTVTSVGPKHPATASSLAHLQIEQQNAIFNKNLLTRPVADPAGG